MISTLFLQRYDTVQPTYIVQEMYYLMVEEGVDDEDS